MSSLNEIKNYDVEVLTENKAEQMRNELRQSPEVLNLVRTIDTRNQMSLLDFGKEPAVEISTFADRILSTMSSSSVTDSGEMLRQLGKTMDKFDKNDFDEPKGFLGKIFKRGDKLIEKVFGKYQTIGKEIEGIHIEISKYKDEMIRSTHNMDEMYEQNFNYYMALEKYVVAGQIKVEELRTLTPALEQRATNGDQLAQMELDTMNNAIQSLDERIYDLEMARMVALQTAPQLRLLQRGNTKLIGKINSAFIITIPIFKNGIIQAVAAKRQKLVADSMNELDKRTNEMLLRNSQNIASQSADIARLAGSPSIKIETIEESWNTIVKGLDETRAIEEENNRARQDGMKRIAQLQESMKNYGK
ncbi:toxic anion resistance protein [Sporosarcina sp.]|uniref:toxic anion resistance protein n=1 Tax=Sporosarcina sp. TaxID=49982 RepID=UPI00261CFADD|nr:toxic anion resistance protein [Sporosarcina sp.]